MTRDEARVSVIGTSSTPGAEGADGLPADVGSTDIEASIRRGAGWSVSTQVAQQALRFGTVMVLARILTPNDYGLASIPVTMAAFAIVLADLQVGTALVRAPRNSALLSSTAFWAALGTGLVFASIAALAAQPLASLLGQPALAGLVFAAALCFPFVAVASVPRALLTRQMHFGALEGISLAVSAMAAAGALVLGVAGAGPWSLVIQQLLLAVGLAAGLWFVTRWKPMLAVSGHMLRDLVRFGATVSLGSMFLMTEMLIVAVLISRSLGTDDLGYWNMSLNLVVLPIAVLTVPVARVLYAGFARIAGETERIARMWLDGVRLLALLIFPVLGLLIAMASDFVPLLLGGQWIGAVPIVQVLAVLAAIRALQAWNLLITDAAGRPHVAAILSGVSLVAACTAVAAGVRVSLLTVAVLYVLALFLFVEIPAFVVVVRELRLHPIAVLSRLAGLVISTVLASVVAGLVRHTLAEHGTGPATRVAICLLVGLAVYVLCVRLFAPTVWGQARDSARRAGARLGSRHGEAG